MDDIQSHIKVHQRHVGRVWSGWGLVHIKAFKLHPSPHQRDVFTRDVWGQYALEEYSPASFPGFSASFSGYSWRGRRMNLEGLGTRLSSQCCMVCVFLTITDSVQRSLEAFEGKHNTIPITPSQEFSTRIAVSLDLHALYIFRVY